MNLVKTNLTIELPAKVQAELEKDFTQLEQTTGQSREYHIAEALVRYIEDMEDMHDFEKHLKNKNQAKYYTTEELSKRLGI